MDLDKKEKSENAVLGEIQKNKLKAIHIHTDYKFVGDTSRFKGGFFDNIIIIIDNGEPYKGHYQQEAIFLKKEDFKKILIICQNADLVILYDLDFLKSRIALALPENIKVAWRFFGYELYLKKRYLFLSSRSLDASKENVQKSNASAVIQRFKKVYYFLKYGSSPLELFFKAIVRINYMLVLSKEEYDFVSGHWNQLPEFVKLSHRKVDKSIELPDLKVKKNKREVVIGNNGSVYNNHLDIIEMINKSAKKDAYKFNLLFNYASKISYKEVIKNAVVNKPYFNFIEEFIPPEQFEKFYREISALVINGYRQMAGVNIFLAISYGTKIYLNKKNIFLDWLRNEGFIIYTIENFKQDLENDNLVLDHPTAKHNLNQLISFSERYNSSNFQKNLHNKIIG